MRKSSAEPRPSYRDRKSTSRFSKQISPATQSYCPPNRRQNATTQRSVRVVARVPLASTTSPVGTTSSEASSTPIASVSNNLATYSSSSTPSVPTSNQTTATSSSSRNCSSGGSSSGGVLCLPPQSSTVSNHAIVELSLTDGFPSPRLKHFVWLIHPLINITEVLVVSLRLL